MLQILMERRDPARNMARFYVLSLEPSLYGDIALVREWGRLGASGRRRIELHPDVAGATISLETWLRRKRRRGYVARFTAAEPTAGV